MDYEAVVSCRNKLEQMLGTAGIARIILSRTSFARAVPGGEEHKGYENYDDRNHDEKVVPKFGF
jgi:hypothetical protein